jgi:peroxiredoxin
MPRPALTNLSLRACLFGLALLAGCEGKPDAGRTAPAVLAVGQPAPPYAGVTISGEPLALADLRGRVVLLNIWATWCEPCREELPDLQALHARLGPRGLTVLGVSTDGAREATTLRNMVSGLGLQYPVIHDARNQISAPYRVGGYPTSFVLDRKGVLRWRRDGMIPRDDADLLAVLEAALAEAP